MRISRATFVTGIALLLGTGLLTGNQKAVTEEEDPLPRMIEQRRLFLEQQERKRLQLASELEFAPRLAQPLPINFCIMPPQTAAPSIDPHRSLFVHDRATLDAGDFSLWRTLDQLAVQVLPQVPGMSATKIFRQFWDTQNKPPAVTTNGPHCDDNGMTINGFPITCPRNEGAEAPLSDGAVNNRIALYKALALVNRLDLAHAGWRNCGEYRIVYGRSGLPVPAGKNLIIFEAVLPNPRPGCREGCIPVAEFWASLSTITDPGDRAALLEQFFYTGIPGFRPVVHVDHYSASGVSTGYGSSGGGQIRTNQFLSQPWTLKEFKTVLDCGNAPPCTFEVVPIAVKMNPYGPLWNEDNTTGTAFRADTATFSNLIRLSSSELMKIGYEVAPTHDAGQSVAQGFPLLLDNNYRYQMNLASGNNTTFRSLLASFGLSADQMANRALAQSCAGCHQPSNFGINQPGAIGTVYAPVGSPVQLINHWPDPAPGGFVHVDPTLSTVPLPELSNTQIYGAGLGQRISPALRDYFLPERKNFLVSQLNHARCSCPRRFRTFTPALRQRAMDIEAQVNEQFVTKAEDLDRRATALEPGDRKAAEELIHARNQLMAEHERTLLAALERANVRVPDAELLDLKPRPMRLKSRTAAARAKEVNELLRQEPPLRTVTGSFRVH